MDENASFSATLELDVGAAYPSSDDSTPNLDAIRVGQRTFDSIHRTLVSRGDEWKAARRAARDETAPQAARSAAERATAERSDEFRALAAMVRLRPDTISKIVSAIANRSTASRTLVSALAAAETREAETALTKLATDRRLAAALRKQVVVSMLQLTRPAGSTLDAVLALLSDEAVHTHALYAVGSLSRRLRLSGETLVSARASAALLRELSAARLAGNKIDVLRAIANSGDPELLDALLPLATAREAEIRGAALEAMRLMDTTRVDDILVERIANEQDPEVLRAAVNAAKPRSPTAALAETVALLAQQEDNAYVRKDAIAVLKRWLPDHPELRSALQQIADNDPARGLRLAAAAAL